MQSLNIISYCNILMSEITVEPIPAFNDNYFWMIENDQECWVVDPGDAAPVKAALSSKERGLTGILVTHHHSDHIGGISELINDDMPVIGPSINPYRLVNDPVSEGDIRKICGLEFRVLDVPGHTLNHLAYYVEKSDHLAKPMLFCGDTLFAGGCGRLFEGTPDQMYRSLAKLSNLNPETLVYCAHEYTLANLAFAQSIEPNNQKLKEHSQDMFKVREKNTPTIPSNIGVEKEINPFLRTFSEEIVLSAQKYDASTSDKPSEIFATIRRMKDNF